MSASDRLRVALRDAANAARDMDAQCSAVEHDARWYSVHCGLIAGHDGDHRWSKGRTPASPFVEWADESAREHVRGSWSRPRGA